MNHSARRGQSPFASLLPLAALMLTSCTAASDLNSEPVLSIGERLEADSAVDCSYPAVPENDICHTVQLDSGFVVRYAIVEGDMSPEGTTTGGLILIEPGGPGWSPLSSGSVGPIVNTVRESMGTSTGARYLVIEEPWVTAPLPQAGCAQSGERLLSSLDSGLKPSQLSCSEASTPFGWTPELYQKAVRAILDDQGTTLDGYIGASFGAVRLHYLQETAPNWAILISPLPIDSELGLILEHQGVNAAGNLAGIESIFAEYVGQVPDGSASVLSKADLSAAAVQLLSQSDLSIDELTQQTLAQLSAAYVGSYGRGQLSLGRLAYFEELCPATRLTPPNDTDVSELVAFLYDYHSQCLGSADPRAELLQLPETENICIVLGDNDPLVPASLMREYAERIGSKLVVEDGMKHGSLALSGECSALVAS